MAYATITDLGNEGMPVAAFGTLTTPQKQAALDECASEMDGYFAGRWPLPLLTWDAAVTACNCHMAAYKLMVVRGFNPASGADVNFRLRYEDSIKWLQGVRNKAIHPIVTYAAAPSADYQQPAVITSSMVTTGGFVGRQRGW